MSPWDRGRPARRWCAWPSAMSPWDRGRPARRWCAWPSAMSPWDRGRPARTRHIIGGMDPLGPRASRPHRAWHSRGYLPHFDHPGLVQSVTFRLVDSVPRDVIDGWRSELDLAGGESADDPRCVELRERIDRYADQGKGNCWLRVPDVADIVEDALLHFDGRRYLLLAWCVMPNHLHVLIETRDGFPLGDVVHSWKSFTAKKCNRRLGRKGGFWKLDYHDRFIRDANHLEKVTEYIEGNPVKVGLCKKPEEWPWSSASARAAGGTPAVPGAHSRRPCAPPAGGTPAVPGAHSRRPCTPPAGGTPAVPGPPWSHGCAPACCRS